MGLFDMRLLEASGLARPKEGSRSREVKAPEGIWDGASWFERPEGVRVRSRALEMNESAECKKGKETKSRSG